MGTRRTAEERVWSFVNKTDGCWEWTGGRGRLSAVRSGGLVYGTFHPHHGYSVGAHRFSYELAFGTIPAGMQIDHLCGNKPCVRPDHLEAVTPRENMRRGATLAAANALKTHCPQGHEYDELNTYRRPDKYERGCRICRTNQTNAFYTRKRATATH